MLRTRNPVNKYFESKILHAAGYLLMLSYGAYYVHIGQDHILMYSWSVPAGCHGHQLCHMKAIFVVLCWINTCVNTIEKYHIWYLSALYWWFFVNIRTLLIDVPWLIFITKATNMRYVWVCTLLIFISLLTWQYCDPSEVGILVH